MKIASVVAGRQHATKAAAVHRSIPDGCVHAVVDWGLSDRPYGVASLAQLGLAVSITLGLSRDLSERPRARVQQELTNALQRLGALDAVIVYGDLDQSVVAAMSAQASGVPIVHVEGGLRSLDESDDEESNRIFLDEVSTFHVTHCEEGAERLISMGHPRSAVLLTAPPAVTTLLSHSNAEQRANRDGRLRILASLHRRGALAKRSTVANFAAVLEELATVGGHSVSWIAYTPTRSALDRHRVRLHPAVNVVRTMDYASYVAEMCRADLLLSDSSGLFDDSFVFGQRLVVARERTHRVAPVTESAPLCVAPDQLTADLVLGQSRHGQLSSLWRRPSGEDIWAFLATVVQGS